jgi:hypothetical protein
MEDIQNQQITGRIYKIISGLTDDVYVGSTVLPLHQRFSTHVNNYKLFNEGKYGNSKSFEIIKHGDASIELIHEGLFDDRDCLHRLEGEYIQTVPNCVNKQVAGRTRKEYREDNLTNLKEYYKDYYDTNKDMILQKGREYRKKVYEQDIEESRRKAREKYYRYKEATSQSRKLKRQDNPEEIRAKDKIHRDKYREKHIEQAKTKVLCDLCGTEHRRDCLSKHIKTKGHQRRLAELNENGSTI